MTVYDDALILEEKLLYDAQEASRLAHMLSEAVRNVRIARACYSSHATRDAEQYLAAVLDGVWPGWRRRMWAGGIDG